MKLFLTAFDPFGGERINPALEAVKQMPDQIGGVQILKLEMPTVFGKSVETVATAIRRERPDAVLCIGQAGGRRALTPERVAINIDDARIPDNEGNQPIDRPIVADGPAAYFSTLPVKAMVQAMREAGVPAELSNSAGTFVCNHLLYGVLHILAREYPGVRGGFLHVPFIPEQAAARPSPVPSLPLAEIVRGLEAAVRAIEVNQADIPTAEGSLH